MARNEQEGMDQRPVERLDHLSVNERRFAGKAQLLPNGRAAPSIETSGDPPATEGPVWCSPSTNLAPGHGRVRWHWLGGPHRDAGDPCRFDPPRRDEP
jgi:hypothetical protein